MLDIEQWTILTENNNYLVSNKGRIKNNKDVICKPFINNSGYYCIGLWKNNKKTTYCIHKLVAKYYLKGYNVNLDIDHIDNNKLNNDISNLQQLSHKDNCNKRSKVKLLLVNKDGSIIKSFTSYRTAARYVRVGEYKLKNKIIDNSITPIFSQKLWRTLYFKKY